MTSKEDATEAGIRFFGEIRPGDNVIPFIFAHRIYAREPVRPFCCGDWLSSDRPPLQSGAVLLVRKVQPLGASLFSYELLGIALQSLWAGGLWCFLTSLGTQFQSLRRALVFLIFSGFLFYNCVYTWPKLLAASCLLLMIGTLVSLARASRRTTAYQVVLISVLLACALLAHPGSVFSLPAVALLLFRLRSRFAPRHILQAAAVAIMFFLPWFAYVRWVDPPGNRLLKMHLAGQFTIDHRSTWQAVRKAYAALTFPGITRNKLSNLRTLAGGNVADSFGILDIGWHWPRLVQPEAALRSRVAQREWIWNAVGLANFGWLAALYFVLRRQFNRAAIPHSGTLIAGALLNLVIWSLVTVGPNETVTTHSSYLDILLLQVGLLGFLLAVPRWVFVSALALQLFNFMFVWGISLPIEHSYTNLGLVVLGSLCTCLLLWLALTDAPARFVKE